MIAFWIIIAILCLLVVAAGTAFFLRRLSHSLDDSQQEREAWQQAQEGRQRTWEVRQAKHILDTEKKLADQLKDARREWRDWSVQLQQDHQEWRTEVDLEKELARIPLIEHLELAHQGTNGRIKPNDWHPAAFYKVDLRGRDLSYRYLERADLREAQLTETNLCMADLLGASMVSANLQRANLLGANLAGVDLRGANLSGADLMVADLHNAVLHGANLSGARNLTAEQLQTAIYDSTTKIDSNIDITLPRIPSVATTPSQLLTSTAETPLPVSNTALNEEQVNSEAATVEQISPALAQDEQAMNPTTEETNVIPSVETEIPTTVTEITPEADPQPEELQIAAEPAPENTPGSETPVLTTNQDEIQQENPAPVASTPKKGNGSKKRTSKAKQAPTATQTVLNKIDETSDTDEETEEFIEETALPNKIIQWPARAPKTNPLSNISEQNKGEKAQLSRANTLATNFNETPEDMEDQHAQAN